MPCDLCGSTVNTTYCGLCDKWLCPSCKHDYGKRAVGAAKTLGEHIRDLFRSAA